MQKYQTVHEQIIKKLQEIVGVRYVFTDHDKLEAYAHDEVTGPEYVKYPEVVVLPENAQQIAAVVRLANEELIPIVPRGAGTGLACGAVPFAGGVVVSVERLNKILEVDPINMFMVTEPGVTTEVVQKTAKDAGFLYAGDPCSGDSSFIGGNVATNAGGNKAVKYGTTRRQIYGLEIVTPEGEIVTIGGKCVKDSTGYSLVNLLIGSEGTLGIITKIYLKLMPLPQSTMDLLAIFPDLSSAIGIVPKIMTAGVTPVCVEFMDNLAIQCCEEFLHEKLPHSQDGYYIIVQIEGNDEAILEDQCVTIDELCTNNGAMSVLVADPDRIWKARKCWAEADRAKSLVWAGEDIVVPMSTVPEIVQKVIEIGKKYGIRIECAGHAGDGNIHVAILKEKLPDEEWHQILTKIRQELYEMVYSVGGKLSGEHGVGYKRKTIMEQFTNPIELKMMRAIKKALDPKLIMNPGKIFNV